MAFLTHFQLLIHYETRTELLTSLRKSTYTYISDHIPEWRRWQREIKVDITDSFLLDWFLKSLHPQICKDVTMMGPRSWLLYSILPNAPRLGADLSKPPPSAHVVGMIGCALNQIPNALS